MTSTTPDADDRAPDAPEAASSPAGAAPLEARLEAVFAAVLAEARENQAFAARLSAALGAAALSADATPPRAKKPVAPPELLALDLKVALAEDGQIALRDALSRYTNGELAAFVRAKRIPSDPPSKLNKTQLLNAILRSAR